MRSKAFGAIALVFVALIVIVPVDVSGDTEASIATDKLLYHPGETMRITGSGFYANRPITLTVTRPDKVTDTVANVVSDINGAFTALYTVPGVNGAYKIQATDGTHIATTKAVDPPAVNPDVSEYSQCANVKDSGNGPCSWTNGNLTPNNSAYKEGDATAQRVFLTKVTGGDTHTITFQYNTSKASSHAYDYLADATFSEGFVEPTQICDGASGNGFASCTSATSSQSGLIPLDPNAKGRDALTANRHFTIRNGTITSVGTPVLVSGTLDGSGNYVGDTETQVTVSFTVDTATCLDSTNVGNNQNPIPVCPVLISFGAHVSKLQEWQTVQASATTASSISGSPYHVAIALVNGLSIGKRDNQMSTSLAGATLTLQKTVINDNGGTAVDTDWTLSATGPTNISGTEGSANVTNAAVNTGIYTLSESTGPAGYTASLYTCVLNGVAQAPSNSLTLQSGDIAVCTITNDDQPAKLIIIKNVVNDNGGTASAGAFSGTIAGTATFAGGNTWTGAVAPGQTKDMTAAGTYTVTETAFPGYSVSYSADCSGSIALGQTKTCTVTNDDQAAKLIIIKNVVNDSGGTASAGAFSGTIGGTATFAGGGTWTGTATPGQTKDMTAAGTYSVTETAFPGYSVSYSADCNGSIALGQTKTCTVTNDDQPAKLIIIKNVVNNSGGAAVAGDFSGTIGGTATFAGGGTWTGTAAPGQTKDMTAAGTYSVTETAFPGYSVSYSADCNGSIALGETKTCTVTNDDQPAKLIIIKNVVNNSGGSAVAGDFGGTIGGTATFAGGGTWTGAVAPGQTKDMTAAGTYAVTETAFPGYSVSYSGDCNGSIALGQTKTCTVTNDDQAAKLIIIKTVVNDNGGTAVAGNFSGPIGGTATFAGGNTWTGVAGPGGLEKTMATPGTFNVTETAFPGYSVSYSTCSGTIALGETKTCTVTNNDIPPILHLRKVVVNDNGGTKQAIDFLLTANGAGANDVAGLGSADSGPGLLADTFALSESAVYGYAPSPWVCVGGTQNNGSITLGVGQEATCTITNNDIPGRIVVRKISKPVNTGSFGFTTTGTGYAPFTLTGGTENSQDLNAGSYTVVEGTQLGWILTGIGGSTDPSTPNDCVVTGSGGSTGSGDLGTRTATINLKIGDIVTCTFENTGSGATRTQGFWSTHPQLAEIAWFGGTAFGHTFPGVSPDRLLCGRPLDTLGKVMGGFWSDISRTSTNDRRSALDQARMQLLQQLLAAELNNSAFGTVPSSGSIAAWESAYCGTNQNAMRTAQQQAASFNSQGDSATFTPGTSADSKTARAIANYIFWDVLP